MFLHDHLQQRCSSIPFATVSGSPPKQKQRDVQQSRSLSQPEARRSAIVFLLFFFAFVAPVSSRTPAVSDPSTLTAPLEFTVAVAKDLKDSATDRDVLTLVVTLRNRGLTSLMIDPLQGSAEKWLHRLELQDVKGLVYQLRRFTKSPIPSPEPRNLIALQPKTQHKARVSIPISLPEESDYRYVRSGTSEEYILEHGRRSLTSGFYQLKIRFELTYTTSKLQRTVDLVSNSVKVQLP